uniref:Large ribosomal subunit protein bL32c n=1 Tax=Sykidion marinum TaxID=44573 RepID=A0A1W6EGJ2_SYKMA|nr:ribosomal protein L32 [Pseudoneochloris marina]ARK14511.1 ribosomal protein L32 [Pseudoneochloris marina]
MAVPKKRTSKSKKNQRKTVWKNKAVKQALQAYSISKWAAKKTSQEFND